LTGNFDLLVLDLGLPHADGLTVLRRPREQGSRLAVLLLAPRAGVRDTETGRETGADDHMAKPLRFRHLLARIRLRMRSAHNAETTVLHAGDLALDLRTRRASTPEATVDLTAREFALLELFLRHPGQVLSRQQILSHVWGYDYDPG